MANPIVRAVSPLAAAVDDVSDVVDAVESIYTPYSPYKQHYAVRDPNMRDTVRLAALGLTPANLAPQPSPFSRLPPSVNKDKLKALETSILTKLKLLPQNILPINLGNTVNGTTASVNNTVEQNLGNLNAFNTPQDVQESATPATDTNTPKNSLKKSIKKIVNQDVKKDTGSPQVDVKTETNQFVWTPEQIGDYYAKQGAKKSVDNPKTALSEAQRDYYRYLTGYQRMAPNQAILSMGLDPNKYYY